MAHVKGANGNAQFPNFPVFLDKGKDGRVTFLSIKDGAPINRAFTYIMQAMNSSYVDGDKMVNKGENTTVRTSAQLLKRANIDGMGKPSDVFVYAMPAEFAGGTYAYDASQKMVDVLQSTRKDLTAYISLVCAMDDVLTPAEQTADKMMRDNVAILSGIKAVNPEPVYSASSPSTRGKKAGGSLVML